jgi:hypothetical protein
MKHFKVLVHNSKLPKAATERCIRGAAQQFGADNFRIEFREDCHVSIWTNTLVLMERLSYYILGFVDNFNEATESTLEEDLTIAIQVPDGEEPLDWCDREWNTFGFDYDKSSVSGSMVIIWPLPDTNEKEMRKQLAKNGVKFITES